LFGLAAHRRTINVAEWGIFPGLEAQSGQRIVSASSHLKYPHNGSVSQFRFDPASRYAIERCPSAVLVVGNRPGVIEGALTHSREHSAKLQF
jgi:hypothetical protein